MIFSDTAAINGYVHDLGKEGWQSRGNDPRSFLLMGGQRDDCQYMVSVYPGFSREASKSELVEWFFFGDECIPGPPPLPVEQ